MKYLLLAILLLSCSKSVLTVSEPIADVPVVVAEDKPIFHLGMPFEGGSVVEPVKSMAVWSPVVEESKIVRASIRVDTVVCVEKIGRVDTIHMPGKKYYLPGKVIPGKILNPPIDNTFSKIKYLCWGFSLGCFVCTILVLIMRRCK